MVQLQRALVITGGLIIAFALLDPPVDDPVVVPDPTPTVEPAKPEPPKYVVSICKNCGAEWYGKTVTVIESCPKCPLPAETEITDTPQEQPTSDEDCDNGPRRRLFPRLRRR